MQSSSCRWCRLPRPSGGSRSGRCRRPPPQAPSRPVHRGLEPEVYRARARGRPRAPPAAGDRVRGELVAVAGEARDAEEQRAGHHRSIVVGEARNLDAERVARRGGDYLGQSHGGVRLLGQVAPLGASMRPCRAARSEQCVDRSGCGAGHLRSRHPEIVGVSPRRGALATEDIRNPLCSAPVPTGRALRDRSRVPKRWKDVRDS